MALSLELRGVDRSYQGHRALEDIDLVLGPGITCLMGPNGSGKSTLMRVMALLEQPGAGSVIYAEGGQRVAPGLDLMRRLTMVLPKGGLFNSTVCANAAYGLRVRGVRGAELRERAHAALERVGLMDKLRQPALTLSSGESQRLAIARAMAIGPEAIFLDEPTASVDEQNKEIIESIVLGLLQEGGPIIVVSTHEREQAGRLGGRVIMLRKGRLEGRP